LVFGLLLILGFQSASAELTEDITKIHDELQEIQSKFNHNISGWTNGDITSEEFLDFSSTHVANMENLILKSNELQIPQEFVLGVELLKSSIQIQFESDKNYIKFIETGEQSYEEISNDLFQKAFLEESEGIARYNLALEEYSHDEKSYSSTDSAIVNQDEIKDLKNIIRDYIIHDLESQLQEKDAVILEQIKVLQNLASMIKQTIFDPILNYFSMA